MDLLAIASRIASGPSRTAGNAASGDPAQPGGYELTMKVLDQPGPDGSKQIHVKGMISGQPVTGVMNFFLDDNGDFNGYDWKNGTTALLGGRPTKVVDITNDESMLQIVINAVNDELGLP